MTTEPDNQDPDPRLLDIPDDMVFGASVGSFRILLSGNRQLVFVVLRTPSACMALPMTPDAARKMAASIVEVADMCGPVSDLAQAPTPKLLLPHLDTSKLHLDGRDS